MVRGIGPSDSSIVIVADYATKEETKTQYALDSASGRKVDRLLRSHDFELRTSLDEVYRTCFYKEFLEGAESKNKRKSKKILEEARKNGEYREILFNELQSIQPNVVIALGELALNVLTAHYGIHKYRGSILPPNPHVALPDKIKVVPTYHPRDLFKQPELEVYVRADYEKALKYKNDTKPIKEDYLIWICKTLTGLREFYDRHRRKGIAYGVIDLETFLGYITYVGLSFDGKEAISIPICDPKIPSVEKALLWKLIQKILNEVPFVNQNLKYDAFQCERWGLRIKDEIGCTMLASHTLYPELPKNLGFLTSIHTDMPYHKDEGKDFNPQSKPEQLGLYNAKDCIVAWRIWESQQKELKEYKTYEFFHNFVMPLYHTYRRIDKRGILIDDAQRSKFLARYRVLYYQHQELVNNIAGRDININSPQQVGIFVYEDLKCPKHVHLTPTKEEEVYSTSEGILEEVYINELGHDETKITILKTLLFTRKLRKIVQFLEDLKVHPDGRLRATSRLEGTENGRTSYSASYDTFLTIESRKKGKVLYDALASDNYGYPFQTIPKHGFQMGNEVYGDDLFEMFIPSPGYAFVEGDLGQAEARVVAILAEDYDTLELLDRPATKRNRFGLKDDMHTLTATWTTEKDFEDITGFDREDYGKRPRHAGNYDQTKWGLAAVIHKPVDICEGILEKFHNSVPKVRQVFHRIIRELVNTEGYIVTPHGRRRDYFKRRNDKLYRIAFSQVPQATVSDHMKWTAKLLEEKYSEAEARCLAEKHDSLLFEVRTDCVERFKEDFRAVAERSISFREGSIKRDYDLVIPLEIGWSDERWSKKMKT